MRGKLPIYVVLDIRDQAHAAQLKAKLKALLANPMLKTLLTQNGIPTEDIEIGDAFPAPK